MTLQINLAPELEARLREHASLAGKDLAEVAREALEAKFVSRRNGGTQPEAGSVERKRAELRAWAASHAPLDYEADDSRESIYEGCGE